MRMGNAVGVFEAMLFSGEIEANHGHTRAALLLLQEALRQSWPAGPYYMVATALEEVARVLVAGEYARESALLSSAAQAWRGKMSAPVPPYRWATVRSTVAAARQALEEEAFTTAWRRARIRPPTMRSFLLSGLRPGRPSAHSAVSTSGQAGTLTAGRAGHDIWRPGIGGGWVVGAA